jgi:hypothetical protein
MRAMFFILALAAAMTGSSARADAIPPLKELNAMQYLLVGVWQEENWTQSRWGLGHSQARRTLIVGNENLTIATLSGILPSNEFSTRAVSGAWTATRKDAKTVVVTLDQGGGRGTVLTLNWDGSDSFLLTDQEFQVQPSRFVRSGVSPVRAKD